MTVENVTCAICNLVIRDLDRQNNSIQQLHCEHLVHKLCITAVRADPRLEEICLYCLCMQKETFSLVELKKRVKFSYKVGYEGAPDLVAIAIFFSGISLLINPLIKMSFEQAVNEIDAKQKNENVQEFLYPIFLFFIYNLHRKCAARELGSYKIARIGVGTTAAIISAIVYPFSKCLSLKNRLNKIG